MSKAAEGKNYLYLRGGVTDSVSPPTAPISAGIADVLAAQIASGDIAKGEAIPTLHELMEAHGISLYTATDVQRRLSYRGLVHLLPGHGYVVSDPDHKVQIIPATERVNAVVEDIVAKIQTGEIPGHRNVGPMARLCADLGLSAYAAREVMDRLARLGWAYTIINRGTYSVPPHLWPTKSLYGVSPRRYSICSYGSLEELEALLAAHLGFVEEHGDHRPELAHIDR